MVDEALARPLVVDQFLVEIGLLEADRVVDAGDPVAVVLMAGSVADDLVIGFGSPVERAEHIDVRPADVEFVKMSAAAWRQKGDERGRRPGESPCGRRD